MPESPDTCQRKLPIGRGTNPRKKSERVAVNKGEKSWRSDIRHVDTELGDCLASFRSCFDPVFFFTPLHFGMVVYILCHCTLELSDLLSDFGFTGIAGKRLT